MKYRSLDEMRKIGTVYPGADLEMSRRGRLERWAALLERHPEPVRVLRETEYQPRRVRDALRVDASALTLAFQDPLLRAQGLNSDTYGEAVRFFGLSDGDAHYILCHCHYCRDSVSAQQVAERVRGVAGQTWSANSVQLLGWLAGASAGLTALGALALAL